MSAAETYTLATIDGVVLWREDLFSTRAAAEAAHARQPLTAAGSPVVVVTTAQAHELNAMRRELNSELKRAWELLATARTARILA